MIKDFHIARKHYMHFNDEEMEKLRLYFQAEAGIFIKDNDWFVISALAKKTLQLIMNGEFKVVRVGLKRPKRAKKS